MFTIRGCFFTLRITIEQETMTLSSTTKEQCSFMVAMKVVESLKRREDEGEKRRSNKGKMTLCLGLTKVVTKAKIILTFWSL